MLETFNQDPFAPLINLNLAGPIIAAWFKIHLANNDSNEPFPPACSPSEGPAPVDQAYTWQWLESVTYRSPPSGPPAELLQVSTTTNKGETWSSLSGATVTLPTPSGSAAAGGQWDFYANSGTFVSAWDPAEGASGALSPIKSPVGPPFHLTTSLNIQCYANPIVATPECRTVPGALVGDGTGPDFDGLIAALAGSFNATAIGQMECSVSDARVNFDGRQFNPIGAYANDWDTFDRLDVWVLFRLANLS